VSAGAGAPVPAKVPDRMDAGTRALVLALPLAFLAHDVAEVRGNDALNRDLAELAARVPGLRRLPLDRVVAASTTTRRQLGVAVGLLASALAVVSVRAAVRPPRTGATGDFAVAAGVVGGHLAGHVAQSVLLRRPSPGLVPGLLVTVPYSVAVLARLRRRGYLPEGSLVRGGAGLAATVPGILLGVRVLSRRLG